MTSLRKILFAGTLVPAVALTPLAGAYAQAPDQERGAPGGRPQHGAHEAGEPGRAPGGMQRPRAAEAEERGGPAQRAAPAGNAAQEHWQANKRAAEGGGAARPSERPTPPRGAPEHAAQERGAGQPGSMARERDMGRPGATAQERNTPQPGTTAQERWQANKRATETGAGAEHGLRHDSAGLPGARPAGAAEHADAPDRAGGRNAADRTAPPSSRGTAAGQDRTPADRTPANAAARDDRHALPGVNPPDRGPADRGAPGRDLRDNANRGGPGGGDRDASRRDHGIGPGGAAAIGAAAGFAGGFLAATAGAQRLDDIRRDRREVTEDGRTYIREPGRTIVEEDGRAFIVHDENDRFRELGYDVRRERHGSDYVDVVDRPGGVQIITYTDASGRMLRRIRRGPDGREVILIDNGVDGRIRPYDEDVVDLPPPPMRIARDRYIVDYADADENVIYDTLIAPPLAPPPQRYTLDQIRYSPTVRSYVRSVDINTINFDTGSWIVPASATGKLQALATAIKRAVARNPNSVFLVEGYTDATGNPNDNLSLSDRRAQSVAAILTKSFDVPPENLTTQGYGQQNLKVNTQGPSLENRRVVVQNITQLLASNDRRPSGE